MGIIEELDKEGISLQETKFKYIQKRTEFDSYKYSEHLLEIAYQLKRIADNNE